MMNNKKSELLIKEVAEKAILNFIGVSGAIDTFIYRESECRYEDSLFISARSKNKDFLLIISEGDAGYGFSGETMVIDGYKVRLCFETRDNSAALRKLFAFTNPSVIGKQACTFGVGDRLGMAGVGHLRVFRNDMVPVLAQQSMRELELTGRSYTDVIDAASWAVFKSGYKGLWAADGDHLKHAVDVSSAVTQGCTMITADLSEHINFDISGMRREELTSLYNTLDSEYRKRIEAAYTGKIQFDNNLKLTFDYETLEEIVLTYKNAIEHAEVLYRAALEKCETLDFEISIDETPLPTTLEAHYFVARELAARGVAFSSIAPRFVGEFQKGIDYIGNLKDFETDFAGHARIAEALSYKISIHSSSDKFSAYPIIAKNRKGAFHLKTSGTNWLISLEIVALQKPELFREIFKYAYEVFSIARSYYHVVPDMMIQTDISRKTDEDLLEVFQNPTDRQVLHISYGEVFKIEEFKEALFEIFNTYIIDYWDRLEKHIGRHIELLQTG